MTTQHTRRTVTAALLALAVAVALTVVGFAQAKAPATAAKAPAPQAKAPAPQAKAPATKAPQPKPDASTQVSTQAQPLNPVGGQRDGPDVTPKPGGPLTPSKATYKVDAIEFFLTPDQFVEYKFRLDTGKRMIFNWKADGPVEVDFHTVPDGKPISASETYQRGMMTSGSGDYRSPYPGLHGWYWHNTSKKDVKLTLWAAGFWTEAWMFSGDPTGDPMPLQDPPAPEQ
jgi:hypothetical protein